MPARCDDLHQPPADAQAAALRALAPPELGARSLLWVPVVARSGDRLGVLLFGDPAPGRFDARAERLVAALAAQGAIGIDNARLVAATQRTNRELEAEVARRTVERDRIWQVSRDLLGVASFEGVWLAVNPAWTRVLGWCEADIVGQPTSRFVHPDDLAATRAEIEKLVDGGESHGFENRFRHRDGAYRHLSWSAVAAGGELYAVARDVTEEKAQEAALAETEAALRQAQKMETLGQLTGGVAHDFNNLLQIVLGNLDMLRRHLPAEAGPRLARAVESATTGAQRAATLTQRLLAFARRQPLAPKAIDANQLILGMADLLRRTLGETITLDLALARELWTIEADPNQLETAMLNLAVNARDAMAGGGRLGVRSENRTIDAAEAADLPGVRPGCHVVLAIEDSGTGMDATVLARIFEPFFTTKDVGHGTGLGLSMVYGFVKQSGGAVLVDSEPGRGTVVRLFFPRHQGAAAVPAARADPPAMPRGAGETILVCEDDAEVRATSALALAELGYRVLEAEDGAAACRLLADPAERIDLLFTDVVLPGGMTGADVAAEAQRHRPAIRTLFTTGYARDAIVHHGRLDAGVALLAKPFGFAELAQRIHALLAGA
ncbi:response regulator [Sphingomonas morindae]|uniref:histidine kinase n=1 Tax=Sphingomonas morindae TaxID=1541170 RepID=A0ABY4XC43_9SPHN|nr:response regulator [Sphingomonas morindae]